MTSNKQLEGPEHTAVRVALWRALHLVVDSKPPVFNDDVGLKLVGDPNWLSRPDMEPGFSKPMRASIVGRARYIEDLVEQEIKNGISQYIILGAGLDSFAQRRKDLNSKIQIFEIDQPGPQSWKKNRLVETGFGIPKGLHFVPVNFEKGESWFAKLQSSNFDFKKPAVIVSTGVSMYLTKETNRLMFEQISKLAPNSTFAITFMLTLELLESQERAIMEFVMKRAAESGTPFLSLFSPDEIVELATKAGLKNCKYVSALDIFQLYFASRPDGLRAGHAEAFLVSKT